MIIKQMIHRGSSYHTYLVQLTDAETSWPKQRVITAVDRKGDLSYDEWKQIEEGVNHPGHFGGTVSPVQGNLFEVKVYVD